jgi:Ca2+-binding RTX toxin-like protein
LVTNNGDIYATNRGILEWGDNNKIVNNALIAADYGIVADGGSTITNGKDAFIEGQKIGIQVQSNTNVVTKITNNGEFLGKETAFLGAGGNETLVNRGTIYGKVDMGAGNDTFDNVGGKVKASLDGGTGSVYGGAGKDTFIINSSAIKIVENVGEGQDLVKSSITYKLGSGEIEDLTLTGSSAINGTGNGIGNHLTGNNTKNTLSGGGGNDVLNGMKGTDILTGGSGADTFVFATGHGKDTVTDFQNGTDHFDLKHFDAVTGFLDLKLHHLTVSGDDLIISYGTDKLVIADTAKAELDASDFFF